MSSNAGGLIRWPAMLMLPLGFGLMCCRACPRSSSASPTCMASYEMDTHYEKPVQ